MTGILLAFSVGPACVGQGGVLSFPGSTGAAWHQLVSPWRVDMNSHGESGELQLLSWACCPVTVGHKCGGELRGGAASPSQVSLCSRALPWAHTGTAQCLPGSAFPGPAAGGFGLACTSWGLLHFQGLPGLTWLLRAWAKVWSSWYCCGLSFGASYGCFQCLFLFRPGLKPTEIKYYYFTDSISLVGLSLRSAVPV